MKILLTGSSGRIGRAIHARLRHEHEVIGLDAQPAPTTDHLADLGDAAAVRAALRGVDAVVHTAGLHAPHVGLHDEREFLRVNVEATEQLAQLAADTGASRFVFTSTTALYGVGGWIDEDTPPRPRSIYHRSKLQAEERLAARARSDGLAVTVLRMSRCFPEPAPWMAVYRLHRGVDARDVAEAHALALGDCTSGWRCLVISGGTPFQREDVPELAADAPSVLRRRAPHLVAAFAARGWALPRTIDRVYDAARAQAQLGWRPRYGVASVLAQFDAGSAEVLAAAPALDPCH